MFSIKIPSKNIYEVSNQKVIDNQIDKLEIQTTKVSIVNDNGNVYNVHNNNFTNSSPQKGTVSSMQYPRSTVGDTKIDANFAYIEETPIYLSKQIVIPKTGENTKILRILTGKDENNQANIKYSLMGDIIEGIAHGSITLIKPINNNLRFEYSDVTVNNPTNITTTESSISYILSPEDTDISYTSYHSASNGTNLDTTATFTLSNDTNILTAQVVEQAYDFTIYLKILSGVIINKLKGNIELIASTVNNYVLPLSGEYKKYQPTELNISFYGDFITLNLENGTISIGSGDIKSFQGNELSQPTMKNIVTNETFTDMWQKVIDDWKNGKETATLRCSIGIGNDSFHIFSLGEIVEPYVLGANGKDKPMSTYKDGTPKNFKVLSKNTIYDGALWQEIGIQEVKQTNSQ